MLALSLLITTLAMAQDTVDIGVIKDQDIKVVQKVMFPKEGRSEIGFHLGWMPFDPFLTTPNLQISFDLHQSETLAFGFVGGSGWGFKNRYFKELESPENLRTPYAFRYVASGLAGAQWSPIYGKMSVRGDRVLHYDGYLTARAGVTLESSVIPAGGVPLAPTLSFGFGTRIFASEKGVLRIEIRDDFLLQHRPRVQSTALKQNVNLQVGWTFMSPVKGS